PTIWQGLYAHLREHPQDVSHLRAVVVGGAAVPPALIDAFEREHGVPIVCAWGLTETSPLGSMAIPRAVATPEEARSERISAGRMVAGIEARHTAFDGTVLPWDGETVGEIEVRGPWVTSSYHGPDGAGADPGKFHDGWLRTGDMGTITSHGFIRLTDRAKDIIKSGGEWISSVDLENDVMSHPAVREAAVIGIPDERWSERPLVCAVLREGAEADAEELRGHLAGKVARWQLPESWAFLEEVPKTGTGKFDKKRLRMRYAEGELQVVKLGAPPDPEAGAGSR
ncbi:MAG: AMP-binding enzyme, partial [Candidatus Dormibacteraceae bacterium]